MTLEPAIRDAVVTAVPSLRGFAHLLCLNVEQAEHLVKETLARAAVGKQSSYLDKNTRAWLFGQYLAAVQRLDQLAQERFGRHVIELAVRWMLDQGITTALWGARHPDQLQPVDEVTGWQLDASTKAEIDQILREKITDPVGPEFMAPPARDPRSND
jgi:aryl-alcohol dehydrogenase-like predicted oxidoreductase